MSEAAASVALTQGAGPGSALAGSAVLELLRRGVSGASVPFASSGQGAVEEAQAVCRLVQQAKYSGLVDPAGAEHLGRELAARLASVRPDVLLVWQDVEDVVLGYVVARALDVAMIRAYDAEGIVACSGEIPRQARAVAVTDAVRDPTVMRALRSVVERSGGELVAIGTLVASSLAPVDVKVVALVADAATADAATADAGEETGAR